MQGLDLFGSIVYGFPPIIIGTFFGYILGSKAKLAFPYRVILAVIISIGGGYLLAQFALDLLIPVSFNFILLSIMGFAGGVILGMLLNWKPYLHVHISEHVIYELDDDDDFEKELDDAIHGS